MAFPHPAPAPRHYISPPPPAPILPGGGLPHERHARIAARRCFVELKQRFIESVARLGGPRGDWLRYQVRQSQDPLDLWLLRGAVFEAIGSLTPAARQARLELQRAVDTVFPTGDDPANSLPPLFL